jgi:hypothetical protein
LKNSAAFGQDEALAFCQGVRKVINLDFDGFNDHVQQRRIEIEDALTECSHIKLVLAHIGSGVSKHASDTISELISEEDADEERIDKPWIDFDATKVMAALHASQAAQKIDGTLKLLKAQKVEHPRLTYFGLIDLEDLVVLHEIYGAVLYERNIRSFLGKRTPVNVAIRETLASRPDTFMYLNNGVTMLADTIEPKDSSVGKKRLKLRGISVINGAQTIASSAQFRSENPASSIADARVMLTIIKADANGQFGKDVTRARNHQNPVESWNFAALDDEQERLRRELAHLGLHYAYKAAFFEGAPDPSRIHIAEAAQALALLNHDPRFIVWLKKEPSSLLDTTKYQYQELFPGGLTGLKLVNAVRVNRYIQSRMRDEASRARNVDRLVCLHGNYADAWILSKRLQKAIDGRTLIEDAKLRTELSRPFDDLRQTLQDQTRRCIRGPLAVFRNQGEALPVLIDVAVLHYGLTTDPAVQHKRRQQRSNQAYPVDLFDYVVSKAPQIEVVA